MNKKMKLKPAVALISILSMAGCTAVQKSVQDTSSDAFNGRFVDSPVAKESFLVAYERINGTRPMYFDGSNRPMGNTDDFNQIYSVSLQTYMENMVQRLLAGYSGPKPNMKVIISDSKSFSPYTTPYNETWIQVISAILVFMRLCALAVQKTPNEVFDSPVLFGGGD